MDTDDAAEAGLCIETESVTRARIGTSGIAVPTPPSAPAPLTSSQSTDKTLLEVKESLTTPQKSRSKTAPTSTPKRKVLKTKRALNETFEKLKGYGVERPGKVLKESYFRHKEWARDFVSGPLDPMHNMYKFYCQLCKVNVSIYGRGAQEILRHHQGEAHLRKDQKWRYHHKHEVDPRTRQVTHWVRDENGHVLSALDLEKELPKFINVDLVDFGEKHPFYHDFMAGRSA